MSDNIMSYERDSELMTVFEDGIIKDYLTVNLYSRPGLRLKAVKSIVLHWTANPKTTAKQNRNYFEKLSQGDLNRYASTQFLVGLDGEIIQAMPMREMAYHVGATKYSHYALKYISNYPNDSTIGIEMCVENDNGDYPEATVKSAHRLAAYLCFENSLEPEAAITRHWDITGKHCPKFYLENPGAFLDFILQTRVELNLQKEFYAIYGVNGVS